jgi:carbamoyl-phosphate synthase large subunit
MRSSLTILVSSAGRRTELLQCFRADARELGIDLRIIAVDLQPEYSASCLAADERFAVPRCADTEFIPALLQICQREQVGLLIPTIDTELEFLAENVEAFASIGTRIVVSDLSTVRLARNKDRTAEFLQRIGVPAPRTGAIAEVRSRPNDWQWPLILKPVGGSSSVGIQVVEDTARFEAAAAARDDYFVQEFWKGREFTVNLFVDAAGKLRSVIPHLRKETRAGEVSKGITMREPTLIEFGQMIAANLPGARGPLCFQAIVSPEGRAVVFEINARFGGGYPLAHAAGATFSRWLLEEALDLPSTAHDEWRDRLMMLRYDAAIFAPAPPDA